MKIGFIGLGRMGSGMAQRLLAANFKLAVFDPDVKQSARLAEAGAEVANSLGHLASMCDVVISMLPSDEILRSATIDADGLVANLRKGAIHMVSGTHGVPALAELIEAHKAAGQTLVACHVLGRPDLAASGKLGLVPGGPKAAVDSLRPVFAVIGEELGLLGALTVILLWLGVYVVGLRLLGRLSRGTFAYQAGFVLLTQLVLQVVINVAVVTALVPPKGIPHPLISYGGSNLVITLAAVGVFLSLTRTRPARVSVTTELRTPAMDRRQLAYGAAVSAVSPARSATRAIPPVETASSAS